MIKSKFVQKLLSRNLAALQRWHHMPCYLKESVAEHLAFVGRMSYEIGVIIIGEKLREAPDVRPTLLAVAGLYHDESELITGDIPFSFKHNIPGAQKVIEDWENIVVDKLWEEYPYYLSSWLQNIVKQESLSVVEKQVLQYADSLGAFAYAIDQVSMGNTFMEDTANRIAKYLNDLDYSWLRKLRSKYSFP